MQPTPSELQQAQSFAEDCQRGLLQLCLALAPRDTAAADPEHTVYLPPYEEELTTTFPAGTAVQIVSGTGNRFTGVLPVGGDACMVFDPTCSDAVISDSVATGGMVVCYGKGCDVTFSNCHFDQDSKIVALAGASVRLSGCTFTRNDFNVVFAHACGTCVIVDSCFFTGGGRPVSVAGGASVTVTGTTFDRPLAAAMVVRHEGSVLNAANCKVQGPEPAAQHTQHSSRGKQISAQTTAAGTGGVFVGMGGRLELCGTDIANVGYGVSVCHSSAAVLTSCNIAREYGVTASGYDRRFCVKAVSSNVELSRCVIDGQNESEEEGSGVIAKNGTVKLQECRVLRASVGVALVRSQGVLTDCECGDSGVISVSAYERSFLDMRACVCKGSEKGVQVQESDCRLQGVTVEGSETAFMLRSLTRTAEIANCKAVGTTRAGLVILRLGARVNVQGFEMREVAHQEAIGVSVQEGGRADLVNCKLAAGSSSTAVYVIGERSQVGGESCRLSGGRGVVATEGAKVTLSLCATHDCSASGYQADKRAVLNVYNCTSTANGVGLACGEQACLHAQDCELRGFSCGAVVKNDGVGVTTCKLVRCRFVEPNRFPDASKDHLRGLGVYAFGKDVNLSMHGCTVSGTSIRCVWVASQAQATLEDCQLSHSHKDCVACTGERSEVTLDRCSVSQNAGMGVVCCLGARAVARRVHSCGNTGGFTVIGEGNMTLKECSSDRDGFGCRSLGADAMEEGTASIVLSGVLVRRSIHTGFVFDRNTKGCMQHCVALQCGKGGMEVRHSSSDDWPQSSGTALGLSVFDSAFERCGEWGVSVQGEVAVAMRNVLCSHNGGWAFGCWGSGSRLTLKTCEVEGSDEPYREQSGGKVDCIECCPPGPCVQE